MQWWKCSLQWRSRVKSAAKGITASEKLSPSPFRGSRVPTLSRCTSPRESRQSAGVLFLARMPATQIHSLNRQVILDSSRLAKHAPANTSSGPAFTSALDDRQVKPVAITARSQKARQNIGVKGTRRTTCARGASAVVVLDNPIHGIGFLSSLVIRTGTGSPRLRAFLPLSY